MAKTNKLEVQGIVVSVTRLDQEDFISLTDLARHRDADRSDYILQNWMRNRSTIEFLGLGSSSITPVLIPSNSMGL